MVGRMLEQLNEGKMKQKLFASLIVIALTIISCGQKEEYIPENNNQGIPFTATVTTENIVSKTATDNGTSIETHWAKDETFALIYTVGATPYNTTATITNVDGSGTATISATLQAGVTDGTSVVVVYPSTAVSGTSAEILSSVISTQNGALSAARDIRKGNGTIKVDGGGATLADGAILTPEYAICKFEIEDVDGANSLSVSSLVIKDASDNVITTVTPGTPTSTLYVTLPASTGLMWFEAVVSGANYVAKGTASLDAGYYYQPTVRMATIYNVIGANGKFYKDKSDAVAASTLAAAVIAYLGSETAETGYSHGLAFALKTAGGSTTKWKKEAGLANTYQYTDYATALAAKESGSALCVGKDDADNYPGFYRALHNDFTPDSGTTNAKPSSGTSDWFLPSIFQLSQMIYGLCNDDSGLTNLSQDKYLVTRPKDKFQSAGGTWYSITGIKLMSSSEINADSYWTYYGLGSIDNGTKNASSSYPRAALAF